MRPECVIYCRVSTESQAAGHGLQRQLECCTEYAKKRGYVVAAIFSEVGSGAAPLPVRAMAEGMAGRRGCKIVCEDYDRWSRAGAVDVPPSNVEMASEIAEERTAALAAILFPVRANNAA